MARGRPLELEAELIEAFQRSGRVTEYLVSIVPESLWRLDPPTGRGRSIAAIVAHIQSVRCTFARMGGARPTPLDRRTVTPARAQKAIRQSTDQLTSLFESAFRAGQARVKGMPRRAMDMLVYLLQHDAHHRGQICVLAKDLGYEFGAADMTRIWGWKSLES